MLLVVDELRFIACISCKLVTLICYSPLNGTKFLPRFCAKYVCMKHGNRGSYRKKENKHYNVKNDTRLGGIYNKRREKLIKS